MLDRHSVIGFEREIESRKTHFSRPDRLHDPLYVITTVFNATRYRSRWRLYEDFAKHVAEGGAILYTVEIAYGERDFAVTQADDPRDIQLRTSSELWLKENAINIGIARLMQIEPNAKYIAWVDADTHFARGDVFDETRHQLQHYDFVQMWSQYQDLTPDNELIGTASSFAYNYVKHGYHPPHPPKKHKKWHGAYCYDYGKRGYPGAPGLAWAARRDALDAVGGLIDFAILGACDWYMAHAMIGQTDNVLRKEYHPRFRELVKEWEARCIRLDRSGSPRGLLGVVPGLALHYWHGPKKDRKYGTRDEILVSNDFNPDIDLKRDVQGLYQLTNRSPALRDGIRRYFRERNEDSIDV